MSEVKIKLLSDELDKDKLTNKNLLNHAKYHFGREFDEKKIQDSLEKRINSKDGCFVFVFESNHINDIVELATILNMDDFVLKPIAWDFKPKRLGFRRCGFTVTFGTLSAVQDLRNQLQKTKEEYERKIKELYNLLKQKDENIKNMGKDRDKWKNTAIYWKKECESWEKCIVELTKPKPRIVKSRDPKLLKLVKELREKGYTINQILKKARGEIDYYLDRSLIGRVVKKLKDKPDEIEALLEPLNEVKELSDETKDKEVGEDREVEDEIEYEQDDDSQPSSEE